MSEATVATAASIEVDVDDVEVLSLLEEHDTSGNHDLTADLMQQSSLRSTVTASDGGLDEVMGVGREVDAASVVSLQHSEYHEARTTIESEAPDTERDFIDITTQSIAETAPQQGHLTDGTGPSGTTKTGNSAPLPSPAVTMPSTPQSICLCQAPARIPRPRNAFILFRQHHHSAVVSQYPGKSNPEISKIIGQMWKSSDDSIKSVWNTHAEEEKRQHLQRYPQYRYQPRRNPKKPASGAAPTTDTLCPTCGGRTGSARIPPRTRSARKRKPDPSPPAAPAASPTPLDGVEALLSLGLSPTPPHSPSKRRKLPTHPPLSPTPSLLDATLYPTPSSSLDLFPSPPPLFPHTPLLSRLSTIRHLCPPLAPAPRAPLVTLDGPDALVASFLAALLPLLATHAPHVVRMPDEPADTDSFLSTLLDPADPDAEDLETARYLRAVAAWRARMPELRRVLREEKRVVLVERYVLSRVGEAVGRGVGGGWGWAVGCWRGCVGADLGVVVVEEAEGVEVEGVEAERREGARVVVVRKRTEGWEMRELVRVVGEVEEAARRLGAAGG